MTTKVFIQSKLWYTKWMKCLHKFNDFISCIYWNYSICPLLPWLILNRNACNNQSKKWKNTIFTTVVYSNQFHFLIVLKLCDSVAKSLTFRTIICKNYFRLRLYRHPVLAMFLKMRGIMHARIYSKLYMYKLSGNCKKYGLIGTKIHKVLFISCAHENYNLPSRYRIKRYW